MNSPSIRILQADNQFEMEAFLLPRMESSMFLLGNSRTAGLVDTGEPYTGTYAAVYQEGRIVAVAAHYWNGNLILQTPNHTEALSSAVLEASPRELKGIVGPSGQVRDAVAWLQVDTESARLDESENLYALDLENLILPELLTSGKAHGRRAVESDHAALTAWRVAYELEVLGQSDTLELREECAAKVARTTASGHNWVLEVGDQPVAMSAFNTTITEAVQVGGVYTPPELRGKGYARAAVAASLQTVRDEGVIKSVLFTGKNNLAAQKAYRALGYQHIGDYRLLIL